MIGSAASLDHYAEHLDPVMRALPAELRAAFDATIIASYRDLRAIRPGRRTPSPRPIALLEHGIGQSYSNRHPAYPGGRDRGAVGLFLSPNSRAGQADRDAYPAARVEIVGSPRLDDLPRRIGASGRVVATTFHWDAAVAPETRSAFTQYANAVLDLRADVELLGHAHPRAAHVLAPWYARAGIPYEPDFAEICRRADLLVADNTSALYEFASTGRPVVVVNASCYRRNVAHGLRFWEAIPGVEVDRPEELADAIARAFELWPRDVARREAALDIAYAYRTGGGIRAAAAIADWLVR